VLVCAEEADREGNLYTGPNTEDTPVIVEAAAFRDAVVIVQVNRIVERLPRVDIPASWMDVVVEGDRPYAVEPLFTRDPRKIGDLQILMGMMVIRGVYERHGVRSLNHGIGFDTSAIELLLPLDRGRVRHRSNQGVLDWVRRLFYRQGHFKHPTIVDCSRHSPGLSALKSCRLTLDRNLQAHTERTSEGTKVIPKVAQPFGKSWKTSITLPPDKPSARV